MEKILVGNFRQEVQGWSCWYEKVNSRKIFGFQNGLLKNSYKSSSRVSTHLAWYLH